MINPAKAYTIGEYIEILRRRIWYIIIPFILIATGASAFAFFSPRLYQASTLVLVSPQKIPEAFVQATVTSKVEERLQSIAQEVLSRTRLEQIIGELKLYQKEQKTLSREGVVALMQKDIKIALPTKKEESKGYFTITYVGRDPNVVTTVANRLASQFIEENLKIRELQAVGTTEFLGTELAASKAKLDELETAVTQYKRRFMGELPEQRDSNIKILEQLQNQLQRVGESMRAAQDRKLFLQKQLTDMELSIGLPGGAGYEKEGRPSSSDSTGVSSYLQKEMTSSLSSTETAPEPATEKKGFYESQRQALTRLLEQLRTKYTENHPDVIRVKKNLAALETKEDEKVTQEIKGTKKDVREAYDVKKEPRYRELNNQLTLTDMEIERRREDERNLISQIGKYRARIEQTPAREQDMAALIRDYQSMKETYERLLQKSQSAQQAENLERRQKGEQFRIIDPARVPEKPFSPDIPKILLIGLLAGIGSGFGLAFFREQMDRSFHDSGDVEIALGLKVLATIPRIEEKTV
ncbi:MAG: GNVR domain-containing protein [Syntrophales bacterium]|nr:GNVR domain-containing protein [Syntrophales bacterium]